MKHIFKKYLSAVAICYLFISLVSDFYNFITKNDKFSLMNFELVLCLVIAIMVDAILYKVVFTRFVTHYLIETILLYPIIFAFAFFGHWFDFNLSNLVVNSLIYVGVMSAIHIYFYCTAKEDAKEMNTIIESFNN